MSRVSAARAEKLSEIMSDVEDAFGRMGDALSELMDEDVRGEDRADASNEWSEALGELTAAVKKLGGRS